MEKEATSAQVRVPTPLKDPDQKMQQDKVKVFNYLGLYSKLHQFNPLDTECFFFIWSATNNDDIIIAGNMGIEYSIYPKYSDRQAWANNVDPDQMPHSVASDQGLHRLPLI